VLQLRRHDLRRAEAGPEHLFGQHGDEPAAAVAQHLLPGEPGRRGGLGVIGQSQKPMISVEYSAVWNRPGSTVCS
jgi:hypothetical protein